MTYMTTNPNLVVWGSDWHQSAGTAEPDWVYTNVAHGRELAGHITSLMPSLVILTGDNCSNFGNQDDQDSFKNDVYNRITPTPHVIRGNHDEDETYGVGTSTSFAMFDATFPGLPYHWTADWAAPNIRFIGFHSYIIHVGPYEAYAQVDAAEVSWISAQLAALGTGQKAILCTHFPLHDSFSNHIQPSFQGTELLALLAANNDKVLAYLGGHRHAEATSVVQDNVLHINGPAIAYSGAKGFMLLEYRSAVPDVLFHYRKVGTNIPMWGAVGAAVYSPLTVSVPVSGGGGPGLGSRLIRGRL